MSKKSKSMLLMALLCEVFFKGVMGGYNICKRQKSEAENQEDDDPKCDHFP
jgi:hypothetical protein